MLYRLWLLLFISSAWSSLVFAQTTFIKDLLNVQVYSEQPTGSIPNGEAVTTLPSGTAVEVLMTDGKYSKISHKDKEGWVETAMLTTAKPQKVRYLQLLAKFKAVSEELEAAKAKLGPETDTKKEVQALGKLHKELEKARARIVELEQAKTTVENSPAAAANSADSATENPTENPTPAQPQPTSAAMPPIPAVWAGAGMVLCLILGLYLGYSYLDNRISKRHGGVRIR
ncbi:MAG: hypothetical protein OEZ68_05805 [Gammaproteobacteria bacterium]|nr:hypothetical protein [Gammaproteobacteria bacterium]MDH5800302.1 hypothetical protein [Gammaproteobacteria bacterium]